MADPQAVRAEPTRRGLGVGATLLLGCGAGCLVIALFLGALAVVAGVFVGRVAEKVAEKVSDDPQVIESVRSRIADMDTPDDFRPLYSFEMTEEGSTPLPRWVVYECEKEGGLLVLGDFGQIGIDAQKVLEAIHGRIEQHAERHNEIDVTDVETRELMVRGEPAKFEFARGTLKKDGKQYRRLFGSFEGKNGRAVLLLYLPEEAYDESQVVQLIESIR